MEKKKEKKEIGELRFRTGRDTGEGEGYLGESYVLRFRILAVLTFRHLGSERFRILGGYSS